MSEKKKKTEAEKQKERSQEIKKKLEELPWHGIPAPILERIAKSNPGGLKNDRT